MQLVLGLYHLMHLKILAPPRPAPDPTDPRLLILAVAVASVAAAAPPSPAPPLQSSLPHLPHSPPTRARGGRWHSSWGSSPPTSRARATPPRLPCPRYRGSTAGSSRPLGAGGSSACWTPGSCTASLAARWRLSSRRRAAGRRTSGRSIRLDLTLDGPASPATRL